LTPEWVIQEISFGQDGCTFDGLLAPTTKERKKPNSEKTFFEDFSSFLFIALLTLLLQLKLFPLIAGLSSQNFCFR
jgi:hypothetical protein